MKQPARGGVSPVRASNNAQAAGRQEPKLTTEQKEWAARMGVTEDAYDKAYKKGVKENPEKYGYRGGR